MGAVCNKLRGHMMKASHLVFGTALACAAAMVQAAPLVFSAAGPNGAAIQSTVDAYRASLGALNPNVAGSFGTGRREVNWDGVPDALAAPNGLLGDFFNVNSPRGIVMTTPGSGFQVSANAGVGTIEFGNINATNSGLFAPFSAQRLFTAIGSNIVDVQFFVPGSPTAALTNGFGVVFSDVNLPFTTMIEYFDAANLSLGSFFASNLPNSNESLTFLGVTFDLGKVVSRARITSGNQSLGPNETDQMDLVVMDDFIYGEPVAARQSVPEPSTLALLALAMAICIGSRWIKRN